MLSLLAAVEPLVSVKSDLVAIGIFEGEKIFEPKTRELDLACSGLLSKLLAAGDLTGKLGECQMVFAPQSMRLAIIGLGKKPAFSADVLRLSIAGIATLLHKNPSIRKVALSFPKPQRTTPAAAAHAMVETLLLACYSFVEYKKASAADHQPIRLEEIVIALSSAADRKNALKGAAIGEVLGRAVNYARDLANHPGNVMTPASLAKAAVDLAKANHLKSEVLEKTDMEKLGMGALLSVNQGSALPPKFIILEYHGKKSGNPTVLVGKGITFDSGGISIKPSRSMEEMKFDMAGAATVLGIFKAASELKLPVKLVGLIPATENLPSGAAVKPGDVVTTMSGKTIEVINTDAEGRMIIADALAYASRYQPGLIIDYATLTGSMMIAAGQEVTGFFTNDDKAARKLHQAGAAAGEIMWRFPMPESYKKQIKSAVADIKNVGNDAQGAGAITAALFLAEFVSSPWLHLDIAGTAWTTFGRPNNPIGATGVGVRTTIEFLKA